MLEESDSFVNKELYYKELETYYAAHDKSIKKPWTSARIEEISTVLATNRLAKETGSKRSNEQHYFSRIYETIEIGGEKAIIKKRTSTEDEITFVVAYEKFYEKLVEIHRSNGHGGRDKMLMALKPKYSIPRPAVEIFVKCCTTCAEKRFQPKKGIVVKPIISKGWNYRGQVDLIDLQSTSDGDYKWLLNYQDHLTKFIHLRPLKSKTAEEVSSELLKIFLEFGAPKILQSDNGREFVNSVINQLVSKWPSCKLVNGRPRHPQSQGSIERSNQDVENMLRAWLRDNNSTNWSLGCYFVQWQKNSSYHRIIKRTPYKALFGVDFPVGLCSSDLPAETVAKLTTEEDLEILNNTTEAEGAVLNSLYQHVNESNHCKVLHNVDTIAETSTNDEDIQQCNEDIQSFNIVDIPIISNIEIENNNVMNTLPQCQKCLRHLNETNSCDLCKIEETIQTQRQGCIVGQKRAAEIMTETAKRKLKPLTLGQNVTIEVPKFDRGPLDPKNILGTIVEINNGVHRIGTTHGILNRWFSRDEISGIEASEPIHILEGKNISLREALRKLSKFGGQGFKKCACKPSKSQCHTNKCFCFKARMKCSSKCHSSGPCSNK